MNKFITTHLLVVLTVILVALLTLVVLLNRSRTNTDEQKSVQKTPNPTTIDVNSPAVQKRLETIMVEQTPILNEDVEIVYSPLIKKYFIRKKSDNADVIIRTFFDKNNLSGVLVTPGMIVYTQEHALYYMLGEQKRLFPDHPSTQELDI